MENIITKIEQQIKEIKAISGNQRIVRVVLTNMGKITYVVEFHIHPEAGNVLKSGKLCAYLRKLISRENEYDNFEIQDITEFR